MCDWTGGAGLPGVSVFYGSPGVPGANADIEAFFDAVKSYIPIGVTVTIPSSGDLIEDSDGSLAGTWSNSDGGTIAGTGGGDWYAGVGVRVQWRTNGIRNGRRVRGATFLCPMVVSTADTNGTIDNVVLGNIQTAASTVASAGNLLIWSRPTSGGGSDGDSNTVLSASVPDRVTALRSRRY